MTQERPTRIPRWMKVALTLSLAVNLLVAGMVIGAQVSDRGGPRDRGLGGPLAQALEPADRRAVRMRLRAETGGLRAVRGEMQAAQSEILTALRAEPFERDALVAAMQARQALGQRLADRGQDALVEVIAQMTPQARRAYADRVAAQDRSRPAPRQ